MIAKIIFKAGFVKYPAALLLVTGLLFSGQSLAFHLNPNDSASCGGHNQSICSGFNHYFPSCDTGHAQYIGSPFTENDDYCYTSDPNLVSTCGGANQPICGAWPTWSSSCDIGIKERLATQTCYHPDPNNSANSGCGGVKQGSCQPPIAPSCDGSLWERLETKVCFERSPNATSNNDCGGHGQSVCDAPIFPSCDTNNVQVGSTCFNQEPNLDNSCGGDSQSICALPIFPTCDTGNIQSGTSCYTPRACGQEGQRACCGITGESQWPANPNLASAGCRGIPGGGINNLVEVAGNPPHPAVCGGRNPPIPIPAIVSSNGSCVLCGSEGAGICRGTNVADHERCLPGLTDDGFGFCEPCGSEGKLICAATPEGERLCDPGYHPNVGICAADVRIDEPDCNCDPEHPVRDIDEPVRGYADLHLHLFSNLAFGGLTLWGEVYDPVLGVSGALRAGNFAQRTSDYVINGHVKAGVNGEVEGIDLIRAQQKVHGDVHMLDDLVGLGTGQGFIVLNGGVEWDPGFFPDANERDFLGWPKWNSTTHQQAYYAWLRRAHRGGLQLAVMMAVNNEAMCKAGRSLDYPEFDCNNGMLSIDLQIEKAYSFETWLNKKCSDAVTAGSWGDKQRYCANNVLSEDGWFKVVRSPMEAREAIARGQLAAVLGIEEANVFDMSKAPCALTDDACRSGYLEDQLDIYFTKGVRHVFPIHNFDNPYGGAATWQDTIAVGNRFVNDEWPEWEQCPVPLITSLPVQSSGVGYGYKFDLDPLDWLANMIFGGDLLNVFVLPDTTCNSLGLTSLGEEMIARMMSKGMIIDIDHMSIKSLDKTLELAKQSSYPGIVASHVLMYDLTAQATRHERMRTEQQLRDIAELGGMIGAMTQPPEGAGNGPDTPRTVLQWADSRVNNDCQASSKTFAQSYEWAVEVMTVDGKKTPVAFGTDFNGISRHNAPRFAKDETIATSERDQCDGQQTSNFVQTNPVQYPFEITGFGTFFKQKTGDRVFDYNFDGLAHVGLLPDMIQDLKQVGLTDEDLEPLFESAEAYIAMWENSLLAACVIDQQRGAVDQPPCTVPGGPFCETDLVYDALTNTCEEPPPLVGDFNVDGCVDRSDLDILLADVRDRDSSNDDPIHDLNGDGRVDALDTRSLVILFSNPRGLACVAGGTMGSQL